MMNPDFVFYSDIGGRGNNEDSCLARKISGGKYIFSVADGLGGHEDGEKASKAAVDSLESFLKENDDILAAVDEANLSVLREQEESSSKMKTTLTLAVLTDEGVTLAHVGDTRIYAFRDGEIVYQSLDHSASQLAVSVGEITPDEIRNHPDRNILTRAMGASETVKAEVKELSIDEFDALLLCSDGFWEYVTEKEMTETLKSQKNAEKWLKKMRKIQKNNAPKDCDNNTAVAVKL